jgi:hypothetical protein
MIAWLLAFLALVGVGWVPRLDVTGSSCWGWFAPSSGLWDDAVEQPAGAATVLQSDSMAARFFGHGAALQRPALGPLHRGRPLMVTAVPGDSCCRRAPDGRARRKRNARAGAHAWAAPYDALASAVRTVADVVRFQESSTSRRLRPSLGRRRVARAWAVGPTRTSIQRAPAGGEGSPRRRCARNEGGAAGAPGATTSATGYRLGR